MSNNEAVFPENSLASICIAEYNQLQNVQVYNWWKVIQDGYQQVIGSAVK